MPPIQAKKGQGLYTPGAAQEAVDLLVLQNNSILAKLERQKSTGLSVVQEIEQVADHPKTPLRKEAVRQTDPLYVRKKSVSENVLQFFDTLFRPPRVPVGIITQRLHSEQK